MAGLLVVNAFLTHVMCLLLDQAYKVCEQDKLIIAIHSGLKGLCHHSVFLVTEAGWGSPLSN